MARQTTPVEEKILELIFRDKVITEILVDALLPRITWTKEANEDYTPDMAYQIARDNLKINLNRLLNK